MKKIISLAFMLVFALFALVSCGSEDLTPIPDHYPNEVTNDESVEEVDLYIVVGEGTSTKALDPIKKYISNKTVSDFNVKLNVNYISEAEYQNTVKSAVEDQSIIREYTVDEIQLDGSVAKVTKKAGAVVLVNGSDFMEQLSAMEYEWIDEATEETVVKPALVDLVPYLTGKDYATLNVAVPKALIAAAKTAQGQLFAFPNSRTLGEYTYLVIDEQVACQTLKFSPSALASYHSYADTEELRSAMVANSLDPDMYVTVKTGTYADKAKYEAEGKICNIITVPTVTKDDAFASAFAIVDSGDAAVNERSMRVIEALNENEDVRNILQYGIEHTNYTVENGVVVRKDDAEAYIMNYMYTGNAFILMYCEEIGWTADAMQNGKNQNKDVVLFVENPEAPEQSEQ